MIPLRVIADANIVIAALVARERTLELILDRRLELHSPDFLLAEIAKHRVELLRKSKLAEHEMDRFMAKLLSHIQIAPHSEYEAELDQARAISPDPFDAAYFALALGLHAPLWTNDLELQKQTEVETLDTEKIIRWLAKNPIHDRP